MALAITDTLITSDVTAHLACAHVPGRPEEGWQVSWLPGRVVDRNAAITAMILAELASGGDGIRLHDEYPDPRWPEVEALAAELGLPGIAALARASEPPVLDADAETAAACVCQPGQCSRREFRDHQGDSPGCMVCADLDPDQACYAAVRQAER